MKNSRFQYKYRKTASKAHRATGEILRTSETFKNFESYQEYPVNRVNPDYESGREHFDWVVPGMKLVIEVMGKQHFSIATFGGISKEEAAENLHATQYRDRKKENAAIVAGWTYITIPYTIEPTEEYILEQYKLNFNSLKPMKKESTFNSNYAKVKDKLKLYRKEQYQRYKKLRKEKLCSSKKLPSAP